MIRTGGHPAGAPPVASGVDADIVGTPMTTTSLNA